MMQTAIEMGIPLQSPVEGINHVYGYVKQNPLLFIDPFGLRNRGDGKTSSGSRSNARGKSCITKCISNFIGTGMMAAGAGSGGMVVAGLIRGAAVRYAAQGTVYTGGRVNSAFGYLDVSECIEQCDEDDDQCEP